jgi:alkanesulfonate monooxygenase SsuD/methylene tetrahydromethanopterin reductase-like flavin-dependent oxidoreductase (luciferase family)
MRINALARRPDGDTRARFKSEAEARRESEESALYGSPDEIVEKLDALRRGGVRYVIINFGGSRENIRRFARDIMPAFADAEALALAGK